MTVYRVTIGPNSYQFDVKNDLITFDGKQIHANLVPLNEIGAYLLHLGDRKRELQVSAQGNSEFWVTSHGRKIIARVEKGIQKGIQPATAGSRDGITAPMPGLIIDVLVKEGDRVNPGQALVLLESMKMQMEIRAPLSARVVKIYVQPKSQVDKGAKLVTLCEIQEESED
jgi:biotin carboxyl carrier protein